MIIISCLLFCDRLLKEYESIRELRANLGVYESQIPHLWVIPHFCVPCQDTVDSQACPLSPVIIQVGHGCGVGTSPVRVFVENNDLK